MTRETLREHFQTLRLPTAAAVVGESLDLAQREGWSLETSLLTRPRLHIRARR